MNREFPVCIQHDIMDCGVACIKMITDFHGQNYPFSYLKEVCRPSREGISLSNVASTLDNVGYNTIGGRLTVERLVEKAPLPCIIHWNQEHFVILHNIKKTKKNTFFYVADPGIGNLKYSVDEFCENWCTTRSGAEDKGVVLLVEKKTDLKITNLPQQPKTSFKLLWPYFLKYKRYFIQLFLGLLVGSLIQLIFPFLTQSIVDIGIGNSNLNFIKVILVAQLTLLISKMCAEFVQNWILLHISTRVNISMLSDFLCKLTKISMGFFDSKMTGDILQRFEDHKRVENFVTNQLLSVLYASLNIIIFGGILWWFSYKIFIVFVLGSLIYIAWLLLFKKKRKIIDYQMFEQRAINDNKTYQLIHGMQEIKLQGCAQKMRWDWEDTQAKLYEVNISSLKLKQNQKVGSVFINETKNIMITFLAALSVTTGSLSLGMMLAIQYIIGQLSVPIEQIAQFIYSLQDTKISMERIADIKHKKDENHKKENNVCKETLDNISVKDLSFTYEGTTQKVLKNINLEIPSQSTIAIVGASGSGKTTLLKLMLQYYNVLDGKIEIGDTNINSMNTNLWREKCGAVMQDGFIFSDTIAKNISISDDNINLKKLEYAVKVANLEEFINSLPLKYNTVIGMEGRGLSQGQKQRILIARAVYRMPQYLFLDEATNALDAANEKEITVNLEDFMKERTVIIVAHRLSTVMNADKIFVLHNGEIIENGNHAELVNQKGYYYNLIKNQLELGN